MDFFSLGDIARMVSFGSDQLMHTQTIFVLNDKNELIKYNSYNRDKQYFKQTKDKYEEVNEGKIYNVVDQVSVETKLFDLVVFEKKSNVFRIALFGKDRKLAHLFPDVFLAAPMFYFDASTNNTALIGQKVADEIEFFDINEKTLKAKNMKITGKNLFNKHSSAIVDLYGNLKPVLALETYDGTNKSLSVYSIVNSTITHISDYTLGKETSPLQIIQNPKDKFKLDIWFLRKGPGNTVLVHLENAIAPTDQLKKANGTSEAARYIKKHRKFPKPGDTLFKSETVHDTLQTKMKGVEPGLLERFHVADIQSDGTKHMFFINENGKMVVLVLEPKGLMQNELQGITDLLGDRRNSSIIAISSADLNNEGKQSLIINRHSVEDGGDQLYLVKFNIKSVNNKVEFYTGVKKHSRTNYAQGAVHFVGLNNGSYSVIVLQSPQTSLSNMAQKGSFVGVGNTHFFLTYFYASLPFTGNDDFLDDCSASIFPNTITELDFERSKIHYRCFFTSPHLRLVTIIIAVTFFLTLALIIYLSFLERRKYRIRTENDNIQRLMKVI